MLFSKDKFFLGAFGVKTRKFFEDSKNIYKMRHFLENNFFHITSNKTVMGTLITNFQMLFSHWSRFFSKIYFPPCYQSALWLSKNGMTLENRIKIVGVIGKNVRRSKIFNFFCKISGGCFRPLKTDFFNFNGKNVFTLMDNYHFWGKIQNPGRSMLA